MKKLLISSVVVGLFAGVPAVYADDAHHPEKGGVPAAKSAPEKSASPKLTAAPDKAMKGADGSGAADMQMAKAQERMKQAQALMGKLREAKPAERKKLMQEHTQAMRDTMGMMREMKMDMMGGGQGMGMMSQGKGQAQTGDMMNMHKMMEGRMGMMQMMMEQMLDRQEMLMQGGK